MKHTSYILVYFFKFHCFKTGISLQKTEARTKDFIIALLTKHILNNR